jgi:hypothetical protein
MVEGPEYREVRAAAVDGESTCPSPEGIVTGCSSDAEQQAEGGDADQERSHVSQATEELGARVGRRQAVVSIASRSGHASTLTEWSSLCLP